jgi:hypothetical protein
MSKRGKVSVKPFFFGLTVSLLLLLTLQIRASHKNIPLFLKTLTETDTTPVPTKPRGLQNSLSNASAISDTIKRGKDTTVVTSFSLDSVKMSKDSLDAPINYSATDSGVLIIPEKKFYLYNKAHVDYQDIQLDAGTIRFDQSTQTVMAYGKRDTANNPLDKATLLQAGTKTISDTIMYNMKTGKGLMKNTFFTQDEIYANAEVAKKLTIGGEQIIYAYRTVFTTCNLDTPHFAFRTRKMKLITGKLAVSGPAHPEFEGVPVPIYLPFGIYPMNRGRHSGILAPQFASNEQFGFGIEGLGYYKVLSDNYDVTVRTNIYSYGGWNLYVNPKYYKRYKYTGNLNLSLQHTKILNSTPSIKDEFTTQNSFMIAWSHSRDNRAHPGTNFSASVNAGSTKFNQYVPNNNLVNFQNQLSSSIQWSKTTAITNLTIAANHDQNNLTRLVNLRLPSVNFSLLTFYPFQKKDRVGSEKWYEKLGVAYEGTLQNQISFYDSAFSARQLLDTLQWGINHRIPISLALPPLGPVTLSPSISYEERWFGRSVLYKWDDVKKRIDTTYSKGFYTPRDMSFGLSANTRIFGTYQFGKTKKIQAIRHEVRPTVGFSYRPDLGKKYFHSVQADSLGNYLRYSEFSTGLLGGFNEGRFGGVTFGVDNLLEMKVKDKKAALDSALPQAKKVRLIDGFGFNGGYNLAVDSFQWSNISFYLRSTLFEKINITANASLDPYKTNNQGFRTKQLAWTAGKRSLGTITNGGVAVSASFQSKKANDKKNQPPPKDEYVSPDEQQRLLDYVRNNPAEFTDFDIPWSVQTSFSLSFYRFFETVEHTWKTQTSANLFLNGDFSLSPKWKIGGNTYFDFRTKKIQSLSMFITRDMHCWQMAINITPVGLYKSFNITLNPKSGLLRDLRINRTRAFYNQ